MQTADIPTRAHIQKVWFFLANLKLARLTVTMLGVLTAEYALKIDILK
jgi:hypothetical protein